MLIMEADQVIGASLREVGTFQEKKIAEVVAFLQHRYEFKPEIFVDIGANIGTHLISSLKDGLFRAGVGVEADPINYALLTRNVVLNGLLDRIQLVNRAISDRCGAVTMELCKNNFGDHRVRSQDNAEGISFGEDEREIYSTMSDTMDELFPEQKIQISSNTLVWIDTQGHEGQVLAGAQKIFFKEKPFVVLEFWPYGLERSGGKNYLFDFLKKCRAIYDINTENWQQSLGVSCQWLESLYETMLMATRADHYPHTDLLIIL